MSRNFLQSFDSSQSHLSLRARSESDTVARRGLSSCFGTSVHVEMDSSATLPSGSQEKRSQCPNWRSAQHMHSMASTCTPIEVKAYAEASRLFLFILQPAAKECNSVLQLLSLNASASRVVT
jgi:hypothetical protein